MPENPNIFPSLLILICNGVNASFSCLTNLEILPSSVFSPIFSTNKVAVPNEIIEELKRAYFLSEIDKLSSLGNL